MPTETQSKQAFENRDGLFRKSATTLRRDKNADRIFLMAHTKQLFRR